MKYPTKTDSDTSLHILKKIQKGKGRGNFTHFNFQENAVENTSVEMG
jgi:hypothetical protein